MTTATAAAAVAIAADDAFTGVTLVVDTRERKLRPLLATAVAQDPKASSYCRLAEAQLPLGDVHYYSHHNNHANHANHNNGHDGGGSEETGGAAQLAFVVERKSVRDLAASHRDGRLASQVRRLRACGLPASRVLLLIEGRWVSVRRRGLDAADLQRVACDVMLATGFHVYHVAGGPSETATLLMRLAAGVHDAQLCACSVDAGVVAPRMRAPHGGGGGRRRRRRQGAAVAVTAASAEEITRAFASQLYAIPRVSQRIALAIAGVYPHMRALSAAFERFLRSVETDVGDDHADADAVNASVPTAEHPLASVRVVYARGERAVPADAQRNVAAYLGFST